MKTYLFLGLLLLDLTIATVRPQAPIVVQAANAAPAAPASRAPAAPAAALSDPRAAVQLLQEMETTNAETLKKQEAALAALDELQKAAEEIKIFSKRG